MRTIDIPALRSFTNAELLAWAMGATPGARLTLTQGTAVTTADVTGATSIYVEPVNGGVISLWKDTDGTIPHVMLLQPSTLSLALGTLASAVIPNDLFLYDAGTGSVGLEKLPWTNSTTRATALVSRNGREYKSADYSRLYAGTFYPTSTTTTEDSAGGGTTKIGGKRFLWNRYNAAERHMLVADQTDNWTYATDTWRVADGATAPTNCVEFVIGLEGSLVKAEFKSMIFIDAVNQVGLKAAKAGVGVDSSTAPTGVRQGAYITAIAASGHTSLYSALAASYQGLPTIGYHYLAMLEKGATGLTSSIFLGDNGADGQQAGMYATVMA